MAKSVPPVDAGEDGPSKKVIDDYAAIELRALDADAKAKEKLNREADQRYWLRWGSIGVVVLIIIIMVCLLWHFSHQTTALQKTGAPGAFLIAIVVTPIVSMTTLSIALLVAAFRGFKDGDEKAGLFAVADGAKASGLLK